MVTAREQQLPTVSVVIPAFRAAGFVGRAIDSALSQEGVAVEVLIVDDACPLDTKGVIDRTYGHDLRVRTFRLPRNGGPAAARNRGIAEARGDWIALLDADDAFAPSRLRRLIDTAEAKRVDFVTDWIVFYDLAKGGPQPDQADAVRDARTLTVESFTQGARPYNDHIDYGLLKPLIRRNFLLSEEIRYQEDIRHGEDFQLYFDALMAGATFMVLPTAGYLWTMRNSGLSQTCEDYLGQRDRTLALLDRSDVRGNAALRMSLRQRASALADLHYAKRFDEARSRRDYRRIVDIALHNRKVARRLARTAIRRILGPVFAARAAGSAGRTVDARR